MSAIPFHQPFRTGTELHFLQEALQNGKLSGNGIFTQRCQAFFEQRYGFLKCLLTSSCTDALELAALLIDIQPGDEVIMPSYTFVSTANAFVLRGARIIFADSQPLHPNLDARAIEALVTPRTKAIVPVHYAGVACDMPRIMEVAHKHKLWVVEDAAQALDSYVDRGGGKVQPLGTFGHLAAFSFHDTKNISAGEGGMLVVNEPALINRAEMLWEKGTNRAAFQRGEVGRYQWMDVGSSFLPSELTASFLWAQLEQLDGIQATRKALWQHYEDALEAIGCRGMVQLPKIPAFARHNAHLFYLVCRDLETRNYIQHALYTHQIYAACHYAGLHSSVFYRNQYKGKPLPNAEHFTHSLLRLPLYNSLDFEQVGSVCQQVQRAVEEKRIADRLAV